MRETDQLSAVESRAIAFGACVSLVNQKLVSRSVSEQCSSAIAVKSRIL